MFPSELFVPMFLRDELSQYIGQTSDLIFVFSVDKTQMLVAQHRHTKRLELAFNQLSSCPYVNALIQFLVALPVSDPGKYGSFQLIIKMSQPAQKKPQR